MILHREAGEGDHEVVEGAAAALHSAQFARIRFSIEGAVSAPSTTLRAVPLRRPSRGSI